MEEAGVAGGCFDTQLKLGKEVVCQEFGDGVVALQNLIQIVLNAAVKPSVHDASGRQRVDRK